MDLPFKTPPQIDTHAVGTAQSGILELPKLYSVTPNEEIAITESLRRAGSGNDVKALNACKAEIAAIALKRLPTTEQFDPATIGPEAVANYPLALVDGLFDYLLAERRGWEEPDLGDEPEKKSTGASTSKGSKAPSPTTTTDSAPGGPPATDTKSSATSRSKKSEPATKPTSK